MQLLKYRFAMHRFVECVGLFVGLCLVFGDEYLAPHA